MRLLITGASGFLGRYVVTEAVRHGHDVRAMVRPAAQIGRLDWYGRDRIDVVRADLRSRRGLVEIVRGVDCVIHLAAAKSGDMYAQYAGTVVATENLLAAMTEAGVRRIVAVSSFSVYDYRRLPMFSMLDEQSPVEKDAFHRDEYAHTKLVQERLIRGHAEQHGWDLVVLRPGVIWGKEEPLNAWVGIPAGPRLWVRTGRWARVPLTYVENCAEAVILAAESRATVGQTLNIVDDELPTQRRFAKLVLSRLQPRRRIIPVPYTLLWMIASFTWQVNHRLLGGRAKVPGLFIPARLQARGKPLRYTNRQARQVLGWKPRYSLAEALDRSLGADRPLATGRTQQRHASQALEVSAS